MSTSLFHRFDTGWSLVGNLTPDTRMLWPIPPTRETGGAQQHQLTPEDAVRLDLGSHHPRLAFDGQDHPVLFLIDMASTETLIWPCHRNETLWIGDQS